MSLDQLTHFVQGDPDIEVEFNTQQDDKVCPICQALEGQEFDEEDAPEIPVHPNCRCFYIDAESGDEIVLGSEPKRKVVFKMRHASMAAMPFGKYKDHADCVAKNKDKEDPEAYCASIMRSIEGASIDGMKTELYAHGGKYYAKFFLINPFRNMRNWQVTEASIPKYLKTFIGQPYLDDKNVGQRAHANFDDPNLTVADVMKKQEAYRSGTILDVAWFPEVKTAIAAVEIHDKETFESLRNGEAIYVSPAVAGMPTILNDGALLYEQWFGLHLARVDKPAYGVFAATIKETCTGEEKQCVSRLLAHASASLGKKPCEFMHELGLSSLSRDAGTNKSDMAGEPSLDQLKQTIASLEEKVKGKEAEIDKLTAKAASADKLQKDFDELKAGIAAEKKKSIATEIIAIQVADGLVADTNASKATDELVSLDEKALKTMLANAKAYHAKIAQEKPSAFYNPQETFEVLQTASMASDKQIPRTLEEARKMGWV